MRKFSFLLLVGFLFSFCISCATQQSTPFDGMSDEELTQKASELHPSAIYVLASKLFREGKKDDSVFWFYVGQLRYRVYLTANPDLARSSDAALFGSLNATLGQSVNEYAGADPDNWVKQIKRAKQWDADNSNKFSPKESNAAAYKHVLTGLDQLIDQIEKNKDFIREQRTKRGLENR